MCKWISSCSGRWRFMWSEKMDANNIGDITQSRSTIISSDYSLPNINFYINNKLILRSAVFGFITIFLLNITNNTKPCVHIYPRRDMSILCTIKNCLLNITLRTNKFYFSWQWTPMMSCRFRERRQKYAVELVCHLTPNMTRSNITRTILTPLNCPTHISTSQNPWIAIRDVDWMADCVIDMYLTIM